MKKDTQQDLREFCSSTLPSPSSKWREIFRDYLCFHFLITRNKLKQTQKKKKEELYIVYKCGYFCFNHPNFFKKKKRGKKKRTCQRHGSKVSGFLKILGLKLDSAIIGITVHPAGIV